MYRQVLFFPASFERAYVDLTASLSTVPGFLARLFILAEKYQVTRLQNDIIDAFLIWLDDFSRHHRIPASVIQFVWVNTISEDCMLRLFLIDYVRAEYTYWDLETVRDVIMEKDFWYDLSRGNALTVDLLRECLDEGGPEVVGGMREYLRDDLRADWCLNWHKHGVKEGPCKSLKNYVLDREDEEDGA
jgi:hypothetical protein